MMIIDEAIDIVDSKAGGGGHDGEGKSLQDKGR